MMETLADWLGARGLDPAYVPLATTSIAAAVVILVAVFVDRIARRLILNGIERVVKKTRGTWDDAFYDRRVFHWVSRLVPAIFVNVVAPAAFGAYPVVVDVVETVALLYMGLVAVFAINAALDAILEIYGRTQLSRRVPIKPFVQVVKGLVVFALIISAIATLIGKSPAVLLSGLGAFTAVLLLVFRDPILGLAAGIQLISNNMVRKGDWITVPKYGADGDVIDVSLTTVSVQNWDKTISSIPTYSLLTDTFKNWRGMHESGGRRIKRAIHVDMSSVRFVDDDLMEQMRRVQFLREYLDQKMEEIRAYNREHEIDESSPANGRRITNVGTFRAYLEHYLREHPMVHPGLTFLVRQLAPTPQGLPIEIYVFSRDQAWANYEAIQADIFDHVIAVIPLFDLRVFQEPSGSDLRALAAGSGSGQGAAPSV